MGAYPITPTSRCSKYYSFASNLESHFKRIIIEREFPNKTLEEIFIPNIQEQYDFGWFTAVLTTQVLFGLIVLAWLLYNSFKYGYK